MLYVWTKERAVWELDVFLLSIGPFYVSGTSALRMKGRLFGGMSLVRTLGRKKEVGILEKLGRDSE